MTTVHPGRSPLDVGERYRWMFERVTTGIAILDAAGRFLECNPAFCSLVGCPPAQLAERTFADLVHPDDRAANVRQWEQLIQGVIASYELQNRYLRPDGTVVWVQKQVLPLHEHQEDARQVLVLAADLTAHRRAEQATRDRALALRRFVADSPIAVAMLDRDMRYLAHSAAWVAEFGLQNVKIDGRSHYDLFPLIGRRWRRIFDRCLAGATERGDDERVIGPDGEPRWVRWEIRPWRTPGGPIGGIIIHSEDITARRKAELALQESHAALRQRTSELRRQTGQLHRQAGQLRQLASDLTLADQRARERLSRTLHDHLQQLLYSASLKLARLSKRVHEDPAAASDLADRTRHDLDDAIASARSLAVELFPPVLRERGLPAALAWLADWMGQIYGLTVTLTADPNADPEREEVRTLLFESVRELLFNVVKHAGVSEATVELSLDPADMLVIRVTDTGAGFTTEGIFHEPDITHGLGLFSIRERLVLMGGRLQATSTPGTGACFTLTVPRCSRARADDTPSDVVDDPPDRPLRVLIADDHAAVRESLRETLSDQPDLMVVGEAADGADAVALAATTTPDVVIMDISMPGMDGVEATRCIRAERPSVQVVGLSTHTPGGRVHAILEAGAAVCFPKGDDSSPLIDWLLAAHAALPENRHND